MQPNSTGVSRRRFLTGLAMSTAAMYQVTSRGLAAAEKKDVFSQENLVAWCIVPFDAKKRNSEERAGMLERLKLRRLAYDYRAEHVPQFDTEVETMKRHGIEFTAWWFPGSLNAEAKKILEVIQRHKITPQLWVTGGGAPIKTAEEQAARVEAEAARLRPIAEAAKAAGCQVALYNHGNWFGEPENQIAVVKRLNLPNVGIVYNFHHGHGHIARFPELMKQMQPHLLALNVNGMIPDGDKQGKKILTLGDGTAELAMMQAVKDSGWSGPLGILDHRPETDSEETLRANLAGLAKLRPLLK